MPVASVQRPRFIARLATALLAAIVAFTPAARGDEYVDKANAKFKLVKADRRSDTILIPLLAKMTPPPAAVADPMKAALLPTTSAQWSAAAEWAKGEPQQALIEAVKKVTSVEDWKSAYAFALPYGTDGVDPDIIATKLYAELFDPPTLAAADLMYMPAFDRLAALLQVEATRLALDGKVIEALDVMIRSLFFARQIADREFLKEKVWAANIMWLSLMRMRDIAYVDWRSGSPKLKAEDIREMLRRARDRQGLMGLSRWELPRADRLGAEQLLTRIMTPGGGPNPETFGPVMARIASRERPLRMFSESAKWDGLRTLHAGALDSNDQLKHVYDDWLLRWDRGAQNPFEAFLKLPTDYAKMDKTKFAALDAMVGDVAVLFPLRTILLVEAAGTRTALALQGYALQFKQFPPAITAIRPTFVPEPEVDPLDHTRRNTFNYFVPIRDLPAAMKRDPKPHEILVFPEVLDLKFAQFRVNLNESNFVLYSAGPDGSANGCRRATQMIEDEKGDYLIWPPLLSLLRQNLQENGRLP